MRFTQRSPASRLLLSLRSLAGAAPRASVGDRGTLGIQKLTMKDNRIGFLAYASAVAAIGFISLWIGVFVAAPKIVGWYRDLNEEMVLPHFAQWALSNSHMFVHLFWPAVIAAGSLFLLSAITRFPSLLRLSSLAMLTGLSLIVLVTSGLLFVSVFVGAHELHSAQEFKTMTFVRVLEEFALRESAEERWNDVQQRMAALAQVAAKRLESAEELSRTARSSRVNQLARAVEESRTPDTQKRLLATLSMFREDLPRSKRDEKIVLEVAGTHAGQTFSTSKEFFAWLDRNKGTNGWEPIPLFVFTADKEAQPSAGVNRLPPVTQP